MTRIKDITKTATATDSTDYFVIDSEDNGLQKIAANSFTKMGNEFNGINQIVKLNASGQLPALDGSQLTAIPSTVANTSLSNLVTAGKTVISNLPMPSNSYIDLTLGATGSNYTAPANGYLMLAKIAGAAGEYIDITNTSAGNLRSHQNAVVNGAAVAIFVPCKSGDIMNYGYTLSGTTQCFRFIYAEGSKP